MFYCFLYRHSDAAFLLAALFPACFSILFIYTCPIYSFWLLLILMCLILFSLSFLLTRWLRKALSRAYPTAAYAFDMNCDPEPLLALALYDLKRLAKQKKPAPGPLFFAHLNACVSLAALHRLQEASAHLDAIDPSLLPPFELGLYWSNRAALFFSTKDFDAEKLAIQEVRSLLDDSVFTPEQRELLSSSIRITQVGSAVFRKEVSSTLESQIEEVISQTKTLRWQVSLRYDLAHCAHIRGDLAAEREHLEFVAAHGNKLHVRNQAVELLSSLPKA